MMKAVKFFSLALVSSFLVASSVIAAGSDKSVSGASSAENSVRKQIATALSGFSVEETDLVYVYFSISTEGGFEVKGVAGSNAELVDRVKETLKAKQIVVPAEMDGLYLMRVRFTNR